MIARNLEKQIQKYAHQYTVISIVGPRQSGKTTLARYVFPNHRYVSLENLDTRGMAEEDPRGFLADNPPPVIIDEIQRAPHLFSYLQEKVDLNPEPAQYILTGSQQFLLMESIPQSLAGRVINFKLYPFSYNELYSRKEDTDLEAGGIVFILPPHHRNFSKRVVKTPKLFFADTGLLCFLLSIRSDSELRHHPLFGNIFETFVISEFYKRICHIAEIPPLYFWRDKTGNEIDLLVDFGYKIIPPGSKIFPDLFHCL